MCNVCIINDIPLHPLVSVIMAALDMARLNQTYQDIKDGKKGVDIDRVLTDIYGMMLHIVNKDQAGGERFGLAIRNLPQPVHGSSDTENVMAILEEITGENLSGEVLKVVRKGHGRDGCLGTVLVSLRRDEIRRKIMRRKQILKRNKDKIWRILIIKNMRNI